MINSKLTISIQWHIPYTGHENIARFLIENGASLNNVNVFGNGALDLAVSGGIHKNVKKSLWILNVLK